MSIFITNLVAMQFASQIAIQKETIVNTKQMKFPKGNRNKLRIGRNTNRRRIEATSRAPNQRATWFN